MLREKLRLVPLFGGLVDCDTSDHWESAGQTFVIILFSTTPVWLATLIVYGSGNSMEYAALRLALYSTIGKGELFMYCTALLAPIIWTALVDPPGAAVFPSKISHMVLIGVINLIAATFFGLSVGGKHVNDQFNFRLSTTLFIVSIVLLYLGTVYHTSRMPNAQAEFKNDEDKFSKKLDEHRR